MRVLDVAGSKSRLMVAALAVAGALVAPGVAAAAQVDLLQTDNGPVVRAIDRAEETNDLIVTGGPASYTITDASGGPLTAGPGCAPDGAAVRCDSPQPVFRIFFATANGNDTVKNRTDTQALAYLGDGEDFYEGGGGHDHVIGEGGVDIIKGGGGDDLIETRRKPPPNNPDRVYCQDGHDRVIADSADIVEPDCEVVERSDDDGGTGTGGGGTGGGGSTGGGGTTGGGGSTSPEAKIVAACIHDVLGTASRDIIRGSAARENIFGLKGNDLLRGGAGDDCLYGGDGNDDIAGQSGNDVIRGQNGKDKLSGGIGDDQMNGGAGNDIILGGAGADRIAAGGGRNRVEGGAGFDIINTVNGARDVVRCGSGFDTVRADRRDRVSGCERVTRA